MTLCSFFRPTILFLNWFCASIWLRHTRPTPHSQLLPANCVCVCGKPSLILRGENVVLHTPGRNVHTRSAPHGYHTRVHTHVRICCSPSLTLCVCLCAVIFAVISSAFCICIVSIILRLTVHHYLYALHVCVQGVIKSWTLSLEKSDRRVCPFVWSFSFSFICYVIRSNWNNVCVCA